MNSLKLLKEVNIGYITRILARRVVTILVEVDKNNTIALNTIFLSIGLS